MLFEGKVAIVAGSGPGLGREIALGLAREGAQVAVAARQIDKVERLATKIEGLGGKSLAVRCDVTDPDDCVALAEVVKSKFGGVDVMIYNAFTDGDFDRVMDADLKAWHQPFEVNFFGALNVTRAVVESMQSRGGGRIVMVNTMATENIEAGFGIYAASKAALKSITKTLARELGPDGIRVNGIHPGHIWGPNLKWYFEHLATERGITPEEIYAEVAATTALGYIPDSAEIADAVLLLASDLARSITGQSIGANAGQMFQ